MPRFASWLALAGLIILADFATKSWVLSGFFLYERVAVTSFFNLVLAMNPGASFGLLADAGGWQRWFFIVLAIVVSVWLVFMIRRHAAELWWPLGCALVLGGAIGNLIDRVRFGAVVDFLDFHIAGWHWPTFNLADMAIVSGAAVLIWQELTRKESSQEGGQEGGQQAQREKP